MRRPQKFSDMIGQERILSLVQGEGALPRHILLSGPPGLGKSTLAHVLAHERGLPLLNIAGSSSPKQIALQLMHLDTTGYSANGLATGPCAMHLVLIEEADKLHDFTQWHGVLEDRELNPDPMGGLSWLPLFCCVATTNYPNRLPKAFRDRFPLKLRMDPYTEDDLTKMILREFVKMKPEHAQIVASCARGSARLALSYAESVAVHGLDVLVTAYGLDAQGLTDVDRRYLDALRRAGRPLSLNTIASMIQEDPLVVKTEIEPELLRLGLVAIESSGRTLLGMEIRGSRGRCADAYAG
jgi:Holliday junction DNA helicase RuvB